MDIKRYALAGGALTVAAAIGFVMQSGDGAKARYASVQSMPDISGTGSEPLKVEDAQLTSASAAQSLETQNSAVKDATTDAQPALRTASLEQPTEASNDAFLSELTQSCGVSMTAAADMSAMVSLELLAPCYPSERVTIHHNGMMFTDVTDAEGVLSLHVPALAQSAVFIAAFANGEGGLASTHVPTLAQFDRVVVQSKRSSHLHVHAFEFGADFGDTGHVHADNPRDMTVAAEGKGGFVTLLGNTSLADARVAEVYTYPSGTTQRAGDIHISVDAEVSIDNCGLDIDAQTLTVQQAEDLKIQDLTLTIPECDAVGDFLVLQNLLEDLKVARN